MKFWLRSRDAIVLIQPVSNRRAFIITTNQHLRSRLMQPRSTILQIALFGFLLSVAQVTRVAAQEPNFDGKTVRIVVGFSAGGGFDAYARAIARHLGKHIPGKPTIIVENMPGAGSLIAANFTYNQAKPDGLTIGHFIGGVVVGQVLGNPGAQFDSQKFEWIGAPSRLEAVCALTKTTGVIDIKSWMAVKTPVKLGATGPGSETYDVPRVLQAALGLPMQIVSGYKGTADIRLAAESGEVGGTCWGWEVMKAQWAKALDAGEVRVVIQAVPKAQPDLAKVAVAIELAKSEEAKQLIQVGIHDQSAILRPFALPPSTPKDIARMMRRAFQETMKDPQFRAEMQQANLSVDPVDAAEIEKVVASMTRLDPALAAKLRDILGIKK
jgi:tripartite-type tricarboxylate transporter receptor subunit TctC